MKISIIGTGNMGSAFAKRFILSGHDVSVTGRNAAKAQEVASQTGATAITQSDAGQADIIILATGFGDAVAALKGAGDLTGKVVVDITNPLTTDYTGLTIGHSTSAAEEIAAALPGIRLVKGFNTVFAQVLSEGPSLAGQPVPVFVASDDANAKESVSELARSAGFSVVDAGGLKNARYLEPLAGFNIYLAYGAGHGTAIAPTWLALNA